MLIRTPNFSGLAIAGVLLFQPAIAAGQSLLDDTGQLLAMADYDGALECQSAFNPDPLSASNIDPLCAEQARRCVVSI